MELKQFLMGSLLGDGCISKLDKGAKNNRLTIAHSLNQECYAKFKGEYLNSLNLVGKLCYNTTFNERYKTGKTEEVRFRSKSSLIFTEYRDLFYPEGKKVVPDIIEELDEFGLAIGFMDDGYRVGRNLKGVCFATHGFDEKDKQKLLKLLQEKFGFKCSLQTEGTIYIGVESVPKLIEMILPFVPSCMMYKVNGSCINRMNCKNSGNSTCSQASNALEEGSTTTGGVGSLNNQLERPTPEMVKT